MLRIFTKYIKFLNYINDRHYTNRLIFKFLETMVTVMIMIIVMIKEIVKIEINTIMFTIQNHYDQSLYLDVYMSLLQSITKYKNNIILLFI